MTHLAGWAASGGRAEVRLTPFEDLAASFGFDVSPARLVTALITERGMCRVSHGGLLGLFPERGERGVAWRSRSSRYWTGWLLVY